MYVPKTLDVRMKNNSGKVGRIRITGGVMNIQQVIKELSWLVPGDHQWEIYASGANMFKVNYPTKADYERVRKIKSIEVEETRSKIYFEEWSTKETNTWGLYDVWVQIKGCPEPLYRDYLALFAMGSLIGKKRGGQHEIHSGEGCG
jgi:hypothetical protein